MLNIAPYRHIQGCSNRKIVLDIDLGNNQPNRSISFVTDFGYIPYHTSYIPYHTSYRTFDPSKILGVIHVPYEHPYSFVASRHFTFASTVKVLPSSFVASKHFPFAFPVKVIFVAFIEFIKIAFAVFQRLH